MTSFKSANWLAMISVVLLIVAITLAVSGCTWFNGNTGTKPQYTVITAAVQVTDPSANVSVPNVPVYFIACNPNGSSVWVQNQSATSDSDGWAQFSVDYTFKPGDTVYLGASTDKALLVSDYQSGKFDGSGETGMWDSFSYDLVKYSQGASNASINAMITIDNTTGKMIS
jgi:hypothetical protein